MCVYRMCDDDGGTERQYIMCHACIGGLPTPGPCVMEACHSASNKSRAGTKRETSLLLLRTYNVRVSVVLMEMAAAKGESREQERFLGYCGEDV